MIFDLKVVAIHKGVEKHKSRQKEMGSYWWLCVLMMCGKDYLILPGRTRECEDQQSGI